MSFISVVLAYFVAMWMAGNIHAKWLAFAGCPLAAFAITMAQGVLAWVFTGGGTVAPLYLIQAAILTTVFLAVFLAFGYWRVSRQKAQSEGRSSSCSTAQSGPQ